MRNRIIEVSDCKRNEQGLYERIEKEAFRLFYKSELYHRCLMLNTSQVDFEADLGRDDYKYGLKRVVITCTLDEDSAEGKLRYVSKEIHIFCDIGFIRYCSLYQLSYINKKIVLHIVSFNKLTDMRVSELKLLSCLKYLYIDGKCEKNTVIKNCEFIFNKDMHVASKEFIDFFEKLKSANIEYQGKVIFKIQLYGVSDNSFEKSDLKLLKQEMVKLLTYVDNNLNLSSFYLFVENRNDKRFIPLDTTSYFKNMLKVLIDLSTEEIIQKIKTPIFLFVERCETQIMALYLKWLKWYAENTNIEIKIFLNYEVSLPVLEYLSILGDYTDEEAKVQIE